MILQRWGFWLAVGAGIGVLAGCGGAGTSSLLPGNSGLAASDAGAAQAKAAFVITIPRKTHGRGSRYISASTKSISIALESSPGGPAVRTIKKNLTPSSPGCKAEAGGTTCTIIVVLKPGTFTAVVDTYDALSQHGNVLSEGQSVPLEIVAKKANKIALILGGVPHELTITGATRFIRTVGGGISIYGASAAAVVVTAKDADGNTIVGADSLHYSASVVSGSGWAVQATPKPSTPNTFAITPPGSNGSSASLKITFDYSSKACTQSGAICSTTFAASNHVQFLAVTSCGVHCGFTGGDAVYVFRLPNVTTPFATVTNGVFQPLTAAFTGNGTLFVGNCASSSCPGGFTGTDSVTVYSPPYTGAPIAITHGVNYPAQLAVDKAGDLFVDDCQTCNFSINDYVTMYPHASLTTSSPLTLPLNAQIAAMAVSPSGDLMVATCAKACGYATSDSVTDYKPPTFTSSTAITDGIGKPSALAFDNSGNMFVANCLTCMTTPAYTITKYAPAGTSAITTLSGSNTGGVPPYIFVPISLALDSANNLFVGNGPGGTPNENIAEFLAPGYSGDGTLFHPGYQPFEMAVDGIDDIIVTDSDTVQVSAPPYSAANNIGPPATPNTINPFAISL